MNVYLGLGVFLSEILVAIKLNLYFGLVLGIACMGYAIIKVNSLIGGKE